MKIKRSSVKERIHISRSLVTRKIIEGKQVKTRKSEIINVENNIRREKENTI